jgi:large subunit ribosomal protein L25
VAKATLGAQKREGTGKGVARKLRQKGRVPAALYGRDLETIHLSVDAREAGHLFQAISVENTIVALQVEGEKEPFETLVREVQSHPWKATLVHIDFLRIQKDVAVEVDVPVHLTGIPDVVRTGGGVLEQMIHELPVRCIPSKIPASVELDVSALALNQSLHVFDIKLEEGVEIRIPGDRTVCAVAVPRAAEEVVAAPAADEAAPTPELVGGEAEKEEEEAT